jgi:Xaa-Pro aminopeptidase
MSPQSEPLAGDAERRGVSSHAERGNEIVARRLGNYRGVLAARNLDALLLTNYWAESPQGGDYSIIYLSNLLKRYIFSFLILTPDECGVWVEAEDVPRAREQSWLKLIEAIPSGESFGYNGADLTRIAAERIRGLVGKDKIRLGFDGRYMPASIALELLRLGFYLEDVALGLEQSKLVKDEWEQDNMRQASRIVDLGIAKVMASVREGVSEIELAAAAEAEMRVAGAECFWWKILLASGPEAENWFDSPTERKIRKGDVVLMDFTPVYNGYGGDIARTFVLGEPSAKQREVWNLAKEALDAAVGILREGVSLRELMEAGARVVRGTPYEDVYVGTGHTIGLYSHVNPIFLSTIEKMNKVPRAALDITMKAGMVAAMEIIITVPGLGGFRLEDAHIVRTDGSEKLTQAPMVISV